MIFLGTENGLFISMDYGKNWHKASGELGRIKVSSIDISGNNVFAAGENSLFVSYDKGKTWRKIFSLGLRESDIEQNLDFNNGIQEEVTTTKINYVFINEGSLYLASNNGLFVSLNKGVSFNPVAGLSRISINNIATYRGNLYISSPKGVFVLLKDGEYWENLYQGLHALETRFISFDSLGRLWLASNRGVFRSVVSHEGISLSKNVDMNKLDKWQAFFKDEPTILEVQRQAIKYAEVIDPKKIRNLRIGARLKALVPNITLDYDRTINYDSGEENYYIGPQDWGLGLSWDLSDFIWSEQQRLIDSQVRLLIELRDDILAEVTRLYFERRRLQVELLFWPPKDPKVKFEKELRLEELTASIDALTGGYLSEQLGLR
jgi:hypothetical protein